MQVPLEITFRDVRKTETIEKLIREKVAKLEKICDYMVSCRIAVEMSQHNQQTGNPFRVRITLRVPPGHELVIKRESSQGNINGTLPQTLREAFSAAARQLKELVKKQRAEVKTHPVQEQVAFVYKILRKEGYGFIKTEDGREIYFHRNSVLGDGFDRLEIGTGVRFVEETGAKGPQASTVQIVDKPGGSRMKSVEKSAAEPPLGWRE
ncbi:MAG: HPF/RaiA family ribosome-associated protein [Candidatus Sulfobium sp.]|jgi:cold shock CspA family protein/ribosome-associated translation inhibitor RaiA